MRCSARPGSAERREATPTGRRHVLVCSVREVARLGVTMCVETLQFPKTREKRRAGSRGGREAMPTSAKNGIVYYQTPDYN